MVKPTVPEALSFVRQVYARNSAGCCWHVVLDDGNTSKEIVASTAREAIDHGCGFDSCLVLAQLLPRMSPTQIRKLVALAHA